MRKIKHSILILLVLLCFCGLSRFLYAAEQFELHVLDVGQGQSVLIESDNHFMLIDGGGR